MIRKPVHPIIFQGVVELLVRDFGANDDLAVKLADRLIQSLRTKDLDIVRGSWMERIPFYDNIPAQTEKPRSRWDKMLEVVSEEEMERRPWSPPELQ